MENESEEILIKIEYFDTGEEDPLRDEKPLKNVVMAIEEEKHKDNSVQVSHTKGDSPDVNSGELVLDSRSEPLPEKHTWYKSMDASGRYLCHFCEHTYRCIQTLRFHVRAKHPSEANTLKQEIMKSRRKRKLKCHICQKSFTLLSNLTGHMKEIHKLDSSKSFCHLCHATFDDDRGKSTHLLEEHKIMFANMYLCNTCGYQTSKMSHLNQHLNTHSETKTIRCQFCEYTTNYAPNLKVHERIHTKSKPYSCPVIGCNYSCAARSALRSHQLKHDGEKNMLYCDKCPYKTVYKQSLRNHTDTHLRAKIVL